MALSFRQRRARRAGAPSSFRSVPRRAAPAPRVDDPALAPQTAFSSARRLSAPAHNRGALVAPLFPDVELPEDVVIELLSRWLLGESLRGDAAPRPRFHAACGFFAQADKLLRTARGDRPPPEVVGRWLFGINQDDEEAAELISENFLVGFFSAKEQAFMDAEIARLKAIALERPPAVASRWHASLRAELLRTLDPDNQRRRTYEADERRAESRRIRRYLELLGSLCAIGEMDRSQFRKVFHLYWRNPRTAEWHLGKNLRRKPLVSFVSRAIRQADRAAREAGDRPLSDTQRAWIGWSYLTAQEQIRSSSIYKRLRESVPPTSRPPSREVPLSGDAEAEEDVEAFAAAHDDSPHDLSRYASEDVVREALTGFFQLGPILERYEQRKPLSPGEICSVKRVDLLLLHLFPGGKTFLTAATYALPWLEAIGAARERLPSRADGGEAAATVLGALESFYRGYSPGRRPLVLTDETLREFASAISRRGLQQQLVHQLTGALRFATGVGFYQKGSPERQLVAGTDLVRALESERVGVSCRARACPDYPRSEAALIAAKLRGRAARFANLAREEPRPYDLVRRVLSLSEQMEVVIQRLGGPDSDILKLWSGIQPQFEALVDACRGRESLRTAAVRYYWTSLDLVEGFTGGKVKGLRRLFRLRQQNQERFEDVFSSV